MTYKYHPIRDEEEWLAMRRNYVTSTEVASLYGLQAGYAPTAFELWHIKNSLIDDPFQENERTIWGRRLEETIARGIAEDEGWNLFPNRVFAYNDDYKIGASFDFVIETQDGKHALLEVKTIDYKTYKQKFIEDDETGYIEAPDYYEIQCQVELDAQRLYQDIALVVFILDTRQYKILWRERDNEMCEKIRAKVKAFWDKGSPPPPDLEKDGELLAKIQRANAQDKAYDATEDAAFQAACIGYEQAQEDLKRAEAEKMKARSKMLLAMGDCDRAWSNDYRIGNKKRFQFTPLRKD